MEVSDWSEGTGIATAVRAVFSPLDEQLKLLTRNWSEGVVKQAVWLSGIVSYEKVHEILAEIGQIDMSTSSVWRQSHFGVAVLSDKRLRQELRASVLPVRWDAEEAED